MSAAHGLGWYWRRLRSMQPAEIVYRGWQRAVLLLEAAGLRGQGRIPQRMSDSDGPRWIGPVPALDPAPYRRAAEEILRGQVPAFERATLDVGSPPRWNRDPRTGRTAPRRYGPSINYRDVGVAGDAKYAWEPNRHQQLVTVAQAYALTGEDADLRGVGTLVAGWLEQCPYPVGLNWTSTLELGIRLVNWSVVWQLIGGSGSALFAGAEGAALRERWLGSVYRHAHFVRHHLSRFSSANNHLLGELTGLYVASVTWPMWPQVPEWRRVAWAMLEHESSRQTGADGVHRECAVGYHVYAADYYLFAGLAARAAGEAVSADYWRRLLRMADFLGAITDVGGNVPMFGDSDGGTVMRLEPDAGTVEPVLCVARVARATGAPAAVGSRWLPAGDAPAGASVPARGAFREAGYYVLACRRGASDEILAVARAGSFGLPPLYAHAHCDALSFTLSVGGRPFLVDPGTFDYYSEPAWRDYFRSTAAHTTARVDGEEQAAAAGPFLWRTAARSRVLRWEESPGGAVLEAEHDGFERLKDPVTHRRELRLDAAAGRLVIRDTFECRGPHEIAWFWQFAPECVVRLRDEGAEAARDGRRIVLRWPEALAGEMRLGSLEPVSGWYSAAFGERVPAPTVTLRGAIDGTAAFDLSVDIGIGEAP